ncbi:hypothetical protein LEMLEM_LOCUS4463 [Lemmus lemmus]
MEVKESRAEVHGQRRPLPACLPLSPFWQEIKSLRAFAEGDPSPPMHVGTTPGLLQPGQWGSGQMPSSPAMTQARQTLPQGAKCTTSHFCCPVTHV